MPLLKIKFSIHFTIIFSFIFNYRFVLYVVRLVSKAWQMANRGDPQNIEIAGIAQSEKREKIADHTRLMASLPLKRIQKKMFYRNPLLSTRGFLYTKHLRMYTLMNRLNEIFIGKIGWSQKLSTRRANPRKIIGDGGRGATSALCSGH